MLESSLAVDSVNSMPPTAPANSMNSMEKGLTEAEESTLDTIMQGLGIDSDGEVEGNVDLDTLAIDTESDDFDVGEVETRDFSAEFGVYSVCGTNNPKELRLTLESDSFKSSHRLTHVALCLHITSLSHSYGI